MLDRKLLQREPDKVIRALADRNSSINTDDFVRLDTQRRSLLSEVETLKNERNTSSAEVARLKKEGADASTIIERMGKVNAQIKDLDKETAAVEDQLNDWLMSVPNIPHSSVPVGKDENDNVVLHTWGDIPQFSFTPKEHWEIGATLGGIDFDRGAKLAGSRFVVLWRWAARLERALVNFFLDVQTQKHGYTEVLPPVIVNRATMTGTGQLPKFGEDLFKTESWDYFLIPTAEVPLTNMHSGEIIDESSLPRAYTAQTPCFRSEAGSYGRDTKGLIRMHQFTKVEMVRYAHPSHSYEDLELMRSHAENLLQLLELPYRTITLCTGDMGFSSAKTYDIEVWLPGQNKYREISSCSNCEDFQARRANLRFRPAGGGKTEFVHTLNGSGLPIGRTIVAIIENGQQEDGSFLLPKVLIPYMGGIEKITKEDYMPL